MRYIVIIEEGRSSFGAYVPDLTGRVAVGKTQQEALKLIHEANEFHMEGLMEEGKAIPSPHSSSALLEIDTTPQTTAH